MSTPVTLRFDVTDALPVEAAAGARVALSGWLFVPAAPLPDRPTVIVMFAGGSYDKRYHHAVVPGRQGYSAAEHLCAKGDIVLLLDHLGVGESDRLPDQKQATRHVVAMAAHEACRQAFAGLQSGELVDGLPALESIFRVGAGHSMGGMMVVLQQANHASYDAIMMIGYSAEGVHFTLGGKKVRAADYLPTGDIPDYTTNDRSAQRENFHWSDVPGDVVAYDDTLAVVTPRHIGHDSIRTRVIADEASRITVPVYICLGERDVSPDPHAEPAYFRASRDITVHILPGSAHCQSFAATRHQMWDRMHHWSRGLALPASS